MKHINVMLSTYIDFALANNAKDRKFKIGYDMRISKNQIIFSKGQKRLLLSKKLKILPLTYVIEHFNGMETVVMEWKLLERFMKRSCKRQIKQSLELKSNNARRS